MKKTAILLLLTCLLLTVTVQGQNTITFDDLTGEAFRGDLSSGIIANGYQGLNWNNMYVFNTSDFPLSGFVNGTVSGPNIAAGAFFSTNPLTGQVVGGPTSITAAIPFILVSGYFTSAHQNGMSLEITGLAGAIKAFDETFILNVYGPSFLTFPANPVTELDFATSGGVQAPGYLGGDPEMVLDNLTIAPVPEPASMLLFAAGLGALAWLRHRRVSPSHQNHKSNYSAFALFIM